MPISAPESSRRVLWWAALLLAPLAALLFRYQFQFPIQLLKPRTAEPKAAMDASSEIEYDMPGVLRWHKSGRVERFDGTETVPPSPSGDPANGVASKDVVLDPAANLSARLYLPPAAAAAEKRLPVVVFFHGGAFFVHTAASPLYHRYAATLAAAVPAVVVSVDYRLAPEHPIPAAYDDAFAALKAVVAACRPGGAEPWLAAHGDASRVVLAGDSAGANMAHNTAIRLRKERIDGFGDNISGVALLHPYFWGKEPLGGEPTDAAVRGGFERAWQVACAGQLGPDHPYINPMASPEEWRQLGCRRVLVTTAELCWFVERARAYAEGIKACGWDGELQVYHTKGEGHVYFLPKYDSELAAKELAVVADFVRHC
ncbi:probable carboxylesterase 7 [Lolium perenne]|uniref:probable carboxylesterase 7 n=1 Tax=Lolium perenne TaxID=4522 RepID=UPI0021EAB0A2|nr:probable carboxylesterase 7 [Lolium perenne]